MPHRFLVGATSCSGRTVIHTHTPVPVRSEDLRPYLAARCSLPTPRRPMSGRGDSPTIRSALRRWLNIPAVPVPSITNSPCNALRGPCSNRNYSGGTQVLTHHACPTFYFAICTVLKCSKYSVQILLQSVISGLTLVTPISQSCMNVRVRKVRQFVSKRYTHTYKSPCVKGVTLSFFFFFIVSVTLYIL